MGRLGSASLGSDGLRESVRSWSIPPSSHSNVQTELSPSWGLFWVARTLVRPALVHIFRRSLPAGAKVRAGQVAAQSRRAPPCGSVACGRQRLRWWTCARPAKAQGISEVQDLCWSGAAVEGLSPPALARS